MSQIAESVLRARSLGRLPQSVGVWRDLLKHTHVDEADYAEWAHELAAVYVETGRGLAAARVYEYLLDIKPALELYTRFGTPRDRGRILRFGRRHDEAMAHYQEAGLFAHAAHCAEEHDALGAAQDLYERLARSLEARSKPYLAGLAALNAGRIAVQRKDEGAAQRHLAVATRMLEGEADLREQSGDREAAFRCYLCLLQIGRLEQSYENLAEGYLNCIRILKAKSDRFFTMQYYYDFIAASEDLGEHHSVAELYREAGEYARRVGFIYGDFFLAEAGRAWQRVAAVGVEAGTPTELVENALLAAVACFNRVEDDEKVVESYRLLTELPLSDARIQRYETLAREIHDEAWQKGTKEAPPSFPEYFRRRLKLPEIWLRDVLEAESGQDIPDAIGRLVGDHKNVWEVQRRKALLISLSYDDHMTMGGAADQVPTTLISAIGELGHAAAIPPLVAFFEVGDETMRTAILERGSALRQREVFVIVDRALTDPSPAVRTAAVAALRRMTFPQALDSLVRVFNSHSATDIQDACLASVAAIGTDEACEFLLDVVRAHADVLGQRARHLLEKSAQERMLSALERNRRREPDPALRLFIGRLIDRIRARRGSVSF